MLLLNICSLQFFIEQRVWLISVKIPIDTLFLLFFRVPVIGPIAITVVPANLDSQTKDIGVCVGLDLCLHTANRVRGEF